MKLFRAFGRKCETNEKSLVSAINTAAEGSGDFFKLIEK